MATTTHSLIGKQTVGANGASSITFSNIPQTYTDLKLVASSRNSSTATTFTVTFNGSGSSYSGIYYTGSGSGVYVGTMSVTYGRSNYDGTTSNTFSNTEIYIPSYTSSSYKSSSMDGMNENNATEAYSSLAASLWSNTSAITSLTCTADSSNSFTQYSTFYLYGVSNKIGRAHV